jgi:hypothetical protein
MREDSKKNEAIYGKIILSPLRACFFGGSFAHE